MEKQLNWVHWQNPYTTLAEITGIWNLVSHILKGTNIRHTEIGNLHCRFIKLHAHSNRQVVSPISVMQNCKWSLRSLLFQSNRSYYAEFSIYLLKGQILLHWALFLTYIFTHTFTKQFHVSSYINIFWEWQTEFINLKVFKCTKQTYQYFFLN